MKILRAHTRVPAVAPELITRESVRALNPRAGDHLVEAKLRYQACDEAQCMPPKTITVPIDVVGK